MSDGLIDVYKLAARPDRMGLSCTDQGVCWGPLALVEKQSDAGERNRFVPRDQDQLERILGTAFGLKADLTTRMSGLRTIAKALNEGNLGRAQIVTLHLKLPASRHRYVEAARNCPAAREVQFLPEPTPGRAG